MFRWDSAWARSQLARSVDELGLRLLEIGGGALKPRLVLFQLPLGQGQVRGIDGIVDLGQDRSRLDHRAVIHGVAFLVPAEGLDKAGDLRAHVDDFQRLDRPSGADGGDKVAAFQPGGDEHELGIISGVPEPETDDGGDNENGEKNSRFLQDGPFHFR